MKYNDSIRQLSRAEHNGFDTPLVSGQTTGSHAVLHVSDDDRDALTTSESVLLLGALLILAASLTSFITL